MIFGETSHADQLVALLAKPKALLPKLLLAVLAVRTRLLLLLGISLRHAEEGEADGVVVRFTEGEATVRTFEKELEHVELLLLELLQALRAKGMPTGQGSRLPLLLRPVPFEANGA